MEEHLSDLLPGQRCVIESMDIYGGLRKRLRDMGFQPQAGVSCALIAPSGSPMAFWVRDALVALRREDCKKITVRHDK